MKVLLVHEPYQQPGGEDQVFADEGRLLESRGHEVVRYVRHNDELAGVGPLRQATQTVWNRQAAAELGALIRRERPDVMHCHNTFPIISPAAYRAAAAFGVATVQTLHNYRLICPQGNLLRDGRPCHDCVGRAVAWPAALHGCYRGNRPANAAIAAMLLTHRAAGTWRGKVDRYIALTRFARELFIEGGLPADRIEIKPNFVHPDPAPWASRSKTEGSEGSDGAEGGDGRTGRRSAIFVGRLSPEKGVDVLLDAWAQLREPTQLTLVGDGPLAERARAAAAADPRIVPVGQKPFEETLRLIGAADLLVAPSILYETFGRTLIEAFAASTPAVASRLGAMAEVVEDGRTGRLFAPGDPADLAKTVAELTTDDAARRRMGRAAREVYEDRYTADRNYDLLTAIYRRALAAAADRGVARLPAASAA